MAHHENNSLRLMLLGGGSMAGGRAFFCHRARAGQGCADAGADFRARSFRDGFGQRMGTSVAPGQTELQFHYWRPWRQDLPVLASDIPSNREWVSAGENGWLAAVGFGG